MQDENPHIGGIFGIIISAIIIFSLIAVLSPARISEPLQKVVGEAKTGKIKQIYLVDESLERGIFYLHSQTSQIVTGLDESLGSGACFFDFDNDRNLDLYLVGGSGQQRYYGKPAWWSKKRTGRFYKNQGGGYFEDMTEASGLDVLQWGMGCNVADFNQDGLMDLFVSGRSGDTLWQNINGERFQRVVFPVKAGWSTSSAIGDFNSDGLMDIYLARYLDYDNAAPRFEGSSGYETSHSEFNPREFSPLPNLLLMNEGEFKFVEIASDFGVENRDGRSLSAKWFDINQDQRLDLLVLNDSGSVTRLFVRGEDHRYTEAGPNQFPEMPVGIRSGAIQDLDSNGDPDLILSSPLGEPPILLMKTGDILTDQVWQRHSGGGRLIGLSGYGVAIVDLNNDGNLDIFHANGLDFPEPDAPAISSGQPDFISLGDGSGNFEFAVNSQLYRTDARISVSSRTVISGDIDNDGDRDLLVTSNNNPTRLLVNNSQIINWVGFDIRDRHGNSGNFEKLVLTTNYGQKVYFADHDTFLGNHDHRISHQLELAEVATEAVIHWRDGTVLTLSTPQPNAYNLINQNSSDRANYAMTEQVPDAISLKLASWQLKTGPIDTRILLRSFRDANAKAKLEIINSLGNEFKALSQLVLLKRALGDRDTEVVLAAIDKIKQLELEESYYWISELFDHPNSDVLCAVANTFRLFFIEEEAMIQRKYMAVPHLLKMLDHQDPEVITCATLALAESKNFRAVVPIEKLILTHDDQKILSAAVYALGELRRTRSIDVILSLATDDPALRQARHRALNQLYSEKVPTSGVDSELGVVAASQTIPPCPKLSAELLVNLSFPEQALTLSSCSPKQRQIWIAANETTIESKAEVLLGNEYLDAETFMMLVNQFSDSPRLELTISFIKLLNEKRRSDEYVSLHQALETRMPPPGFEKLLRRSISDKNQSVDLRIAAGDRLIDIDPDFVMSYAGELFE